MLLNTQDLKASLSAGVQSVVRVACILYRLVDACTYSSLVSFGAAEDQPLTSASSTRALTRILVSQRAREVQLL